MGPLPALAWGGVLAQERAGCRGLVVPSHPHLSTTLTLGAYLGQGELHGGGLDGAQEPGVCLLSKGVHPQQLFSPPCPRQEMSLYPQP